VKPPFLVLQSRVRSSKSKAKDPKVAHHVVSLANTSVAKLGRGHESSVRLDEVSMSRWHSSIRLLEDGFFLEDQGSKFGTLLAIRGAWPVPRGRSVSVKVGRTLFHFALPADEPLSPLSPSTCARSSRSHDEVESDTPSRKAHGADLDSALYQSL
jgi:hypothetical protein